MPWTADPEELPPDDDELLDAPELLEPPDDPPELLPELLELLPPELLLEFPELLSLLPQALSAHAAATTNKALFFMSSLLSFGGLCGRTARWPDSNHKTAPVAWDGGENLRQRTVGPPHRHDDDQFRSAVRSPEDGAAVPGSASSE
jgi:hypothetical protein